MAEGDRIRRVLVELADTLVDEFDISGFLRVLATRVVEVVGVDQARAVLLDRRGDVDAIASFSAGVRPIKLIELHWRSGPSMDAHRAGRPVREDHLASAGRTRWPDFAEAALSAGYASVCALPMRLRTERIGALTLFAREPASISPEDEALAQALADVATIGIVQHRTRRRQETLVEQLSEALRTRVVLEQAKGVLAEQGGVEVDFGFERMRRYARDRNLKLASVARLVVDRELSFEDLRPSG